MAVAVGQSGIELALASLPESGEQRAGIEHVNVSGSSEAEAEAGWPACAGSQIMFSSPFPLQGILPSVIGGRHLLRTLFDEIDGLRLTVSTMANQTHETYLRREATVPGSDRSFGLVIAVALSLLGLINFWRIGHAWPWTGALAGLFFVFACLFRAALRPLNWLWFQFGFLLRKVVNPIVMALIFFGTVLPTGKTPIPANLKRHQAAERLVSVWMAIQDAVAARPSS